MIRDKEREYLEASLLEEKVYLVAYFEEIEIEEINHILVSISKNILTEDYEVKTIITFKELLDVENTLEIFSSMYLFSSKFKDDYNYNLELKVLEVINSLIQIKKESIFLLILKLNSESYLARI